jgi:hypothetical protein
MALYCINQRTGSLQNWPRPGGWHEQSSYELEAMYTAWRTFLLFKYPKLRRGEDAWFLVWVEEDADTEEGWLQEMARLYRLLFEDV